jgi:UDP-glucose 4-epimerase
VVSRRPATAATFASTDKIARVLDWRATRDLEAMVASAWSAWQAHPGS